MNIIINDLKEKYLIHQKKLINKLNVAKDNYEEKRIQLSYFEVLAVAMEAFTTNQAFINTNSEANETLNQFLKIKRDLSNRGKSFNVFIKEKKYVDTYQILEDYINELDFAFTYFYPKKKGIQLNIIELDLSDEYDNEELYLETEKKTFKKQDNILERILNLKNCYGLFSDIRDDLIKELYVHSLNRNILVHKHGIIDKQYIKKLSDYNISCSYKLNESVNSCLDAELCNVELLAIDLIDIFNNSFYKDAISLTKEYFNLK